MALAAGTGRDKVEGPTFLSAVFLNAHGLLALGAAAQRWWIGEVGPATNWKGILAAGLATVAGYGYLRLVRADGPDIIPSGHLCNCDCNSLLGPGSRFWLVELGGGRIARTLSATTPRCPRPFDRVAGDPRLESYSGRCRLDLRNHGCIDL